MTEHTQDNAFLNMLWGAAIAGDNATIRILAMKGVDLDAPNDEEYTALQLANLHSHPSTVRTIMAAREFQYLQRVNRELRRIGNFNHAHRQHYNA